MQGPVDRLLTRRRQPPPAAAGGTGRASGTLVALVGPAGGVGLGEGVVDATSTLARRHTVPGGVTVSVMGRWRSGPAGSVGTDSDRARTRQELVRESGEETAYAVGSAGRDTAPTGRTV